jgi:multisubunit Na+/H+ antiporter MnhC subunit
VRDAACYVCWAFARAYAPIIMRPFVQPLAEAMILTALFDREV